MAAGSCITLLTLGGTDLNPAGGEYSSAMLTGQMRVQTTPREVQVVRRSSAGPSYQGQQLAERTLRVRHTVAGTGSTHEANLRQLKEEHYSTTFGSRLLVYDEDGTVKQVTVVAARLLPLTGVETGAVDAEWTLLDPVAYDNAASSTPAQAKSSSPATLSVTNDGNEHSRVATITLTPTAQKAAADGQRHRVRITPINRNPRPLSAWPVDLTDRVGGAGWNHGGEVSAGRSLASGDDVEVYVNGRRTSRWSWASGSGTWNGTFTRIWANLDMPPARTWAYRGIGTLGTGDTTVPVRDDVVNMPLPPFYAAFVNSAGTTVEVVRVTGFDEDARTLTVLRAQRGSAAAPWAPGSMLYWCPVLIDLVYGWTSAPQPDYILDARKPMLLQSVPTPLSSNGTWYFQEYMETTEAGLIRSRVPRTGAWRPRLVTTKFEREDMYWSYMPRTASLSSDAAVASLMALAYRSVGPLLGHPYADCWEFVSPIGITDITHDYDTTTLEFVLATGREARLRTIAIDADGAEEVLSTQDNSAGTETVSPSANAYAVRYIMDPWDSKRDATGASQIAGEPDDDDGWTIDDVELTFDAAEKILLVWGATESAYQLGRPGAPATIADAAGRTLGLHGIVLALGETLSIDCDAGTLQADGDGTGRGHLASGSFLRLPPGTNDLTLVEAGIGTVELGVSSKRGAWI